MANCKACGAWFSSTAPDEICHTCKRALKRLNGYVVPVVRCKDCRFWVREFDNVGHCTYAGIHLDHAEYGFCSYGERKDND